MHGCRKGVFGNDVTDVMIEMTTEEQCQKAHKPASSPPALQQKRCPFDATPERYVLEGPAEQRFVPNACKDLVTRDRLPALLRVTYVYTRDHRHGATAVDQITNIHGAARYVIPQW